MRSARELAQSFVEEAWNGRRLDVLDQLLSPGYVLEDLRAGEEHRLGHDGMVEHIAGWLDAFPDLHVDQRVLGGSTDVVTVAWTISGTHDQEWQGLAATGRRVSFGLVATFTAEDGRLVRHSVLVDVMTLVQQLGRAPGDAELMAPG